MILVIIRIDIRRTNTQMKNVIVSTWKEWMNSEAVYGNNNERRHSDRPNRFAHGTGRTEGVEVASGALAADDGRGALGHHRPRLAPVEHVVQEAAGEHEKDDAGRHGDGHPVTRYHSFVAAEITQIRNMRTDLYTTHTTPKLACLVGASRGALRKECERRTNR